MADASRKMAGGVAMRVVAAAEGTLLGTMAAAWPEVPKTRMKQWLKHGSVRVDGREQTRATEPVRKGAVIEVVRTKPEPERPEPALGVRVVFEDDALLVVEKPAGLLTIATAQIDGRTLYAAMTDYVRSRTRAARVWIVHRLDKDTSGLLVLARTREAKLALQAGWAGAEKRYLAVVDGTPRQEAGVLRSHLDESNPARVVVRPPGPETRQAVTEYRVVESGGGRALVELVLRTGRRHQIRVHLAGLGTPVCGDSKYGSGRKSDRLALHAAHLAFDHPVTGDRLAFDWPLPPDLCELLRGGRKPGRPGQ